MYARKCNRGLVCFPLQTLHIVVFSLHPVAAGRYDVTLSVL